MPDTAKLTIIRGTPAGTSVRFDDSDDEKVLVLALNPTEYSIEKKSNYSQAAVIGLASPLLQYSNGDAQTLSVEILLDTYANGDQRDLRDVYLAKIDQLLAIDGELHAPPPCKVVWGSLQFVGVLEDARKQFTLFLRDGTPVRARVTLSFREYVPVDVQVRAAPRSSPDKYKGRLVHDGVALWQIAAEVYGDARLWPILARANRLDDPLRLRVGTTLLIPPLDGTQSGGVDGA